MLYPRRVVEVGRRQRLYLFLVRRGVLKAKASRSPYERPALRRLLGTSIVLLAVAVLLMALAINQWSSHSFWNWDYVLQSLAAALCPLFAATILAATVVEWRAFWVHRPR
jgi:hypothetical protein